MSSSTDQEVEVHDLKNYGNDDEFYSEKCWDEGEHVDVSKATTDYGNHRRTDVAEVCIHCSLKLRSWKEYPSDFTFQE